MKFNAYLAVLFVILLAGCAKQPVENHRYFLPETANTNQPASKPSSRLMQIREVQLADFLSDGGLVLQLDDITLNQAKNHLWAEDLRQQINRGLRERLNQQQQNITVVGPQQANAEWRLSLEINAFHGRHDGLALTSGQWQIQNDKGQILSLQPFYLQTALRTEGYPALVRALGENLDALAVSLAESIASIP